MLCQLNLLSTKRGEGNVGDFIRCLEQRAEGQRVQTDEVMVGELIREGRS